MLTKTNRNQAIDRQAAHSLLKHIARYRLSTLAAISRLPEFAGVGPRRLRRLLRQCSDAGELSSAVLHHGTRYWFLTPCGAQQCGLDVDRSGPLSEVAKIRAYALLAFCCLSANSRHLLAASDFSGQFPVLHRPGMAGRYYFDPAGHGQLGMARIDAGHYGRWDRVAESVQEDLSAHLRRPAWRKLIDAGRFELAVLTVFSQKAQRVREAISRRPVMQAVPVRIVALPELLPLVASIRRKEVTAT
jgi:hypothetical protein